MIFFSLVRIQERNNMPAATAQGTYAKGTCPFVYSMNEAGFTMGTAISVAGFLLGAYVMTGSVPNIYSLLIGAASIYLGRWGFDNYQTRLVLTAAGTAAGTTYNDYNAWLTNSEQWEATFASWTKWPGLIRNTTMGDATGLVAQQLVGYLAGGHAQVLRPLPYRTFTGGVLGACLADILYNAYITYTPSSTTYVNYYPIWLYNQSSGTGQWLPANPSAGWDATNCKAG